MMEIASVAAFPRDDMGEGLKVENLTLERFHVGPFDALRAGCLNVITLFPKELSGVSNLVDMTEIASLRYLATTHGGRGWWIEG
jgi:hypothetical protein